MSKPIKLPSGQWRIRYFDENKVRVSKTFSTFDLARKELSRRENGVEDAKVRRERYGSEAMTVAEAWVEFRTRKLEVGVDTKRRFEKRGREHQRHYEMHIEPYLAEVPLADLTPKRLREWVDKLKATKTGRPGELNEDGRTLGASTIRNVVTTLRQIAKANDVPLVVALGNALKQKRRRSRPRALQSLADVRALVAACSDPWFKVAAAIACYCGARLGEVASLRWRHVDFAKRTITIALSWEGPLKARYENDEAKRIVPLDDDLAEILTAWRKVTKGKEDRDRVVLVGGVRPLREGHDDVAAKTRAACKIAQLEPLTYHSLRASFATLVADAGLPIGKLQVLLGHADAATTSIYIRSDSEVAALDPRARLGGREVN